MRIIVDTGDSVLVGYQKIRNLLKPYYKYLDTFDKLNCGDIVDKKCPLCAGDIKLYRMGNSYEFRCDTPNCVVYGARGI